MKHIPSLFLIHFLLFSNLSAVESFFLMPRDADIALKTLAHDLQNAKKSIRVAIYSFTHKRLADSLKKAARRGVEVTIIFDQASNSPKGYSRIGDLAKIRSIRTYTLRGIPNRKKGYYGKMHMKLALIDGEKAYFGSANWSNSAFSRNYETLYSTESLPLIREAGAYFEEMLQYATPYD